jgi:MFS family permease
LGDRDRHLVAGRLRVRLGVFYGGWVAVLPAVVMDYFGGRNVSGIIGILYTSVAFGTLIGPSAAGFAFDLSHSYTLPILASAAANIVAAVIVVATANITGGRHRPSVARTVERGTPVKS